MFTYLCLVCLFDMHHLMAVCLFDMHHLMVVCLFDMHHLMAVCLFDLHHLMAVCLFDMHHLMAVCLCLVLLCCFLMYLKQHSSSEGHHQLTQVGHQVSDHLCINYRNTLTIVLWENMIIFII